MRAVGWLCAFGMAAILILAFVLGLPGPGSPRGILPWGRLAPAGLAALGIAGAALLVRSSRIASLLAATGGLAEAAWAAWLRTHLMAIRARPDSLALGGGLARSRRGCRATRRGGSRSDPLRGGRGAMFRMLLTVAFGYLALQAIRNIGLFGLAAGFVLAWNLGNGPSSSRPRFPQRESGLHRASRLEPSVAVLIGLVIITVVTGGFFRATAESRHFGLREAPLAYAHEAAQFAGQPGLPDRALVFGLRQAGVYLFHNGPDAKVLHGRPPGSARQVDV